MATPWFCGHGQPVKAIRLRATNAVGSRMQTEPRRVLADD